MKLWPSKYFLGDHVINYDNPVILYTTHIFIWILIPTPKLLTLVSVLNELFNNHSKQTTAAINYRK